MKLIIEHQKGSGIKGPLERAEIQKQYPGDLIYRFVLYGIVPVEMIGVHLVTEIEHGIVKVK